MKLRVGKLRRVTTYWWLLFTMLLCSPLLNADEDLTKKSSEEKSKTFESQTKSESSASANKESVTNKKKSKVIETKAPPPTKEEEQSLAGAKAVQEGAEASMEDDASFKKADPGWKPEPPSVKERTGNWVEVEDVDDVKKVALGDANSVWVLDKQGKLSRLEKDGLQAEAMGVIDFDASHDWVVAINKDKEALEHKGTGEWAKIDGLKLDQISIGSRKIAWGVLKDGDDYKVFKLKDDKWQQVRDSQDEPAEGLKQVSVNEAAVVIALDEKDVPYSRTLDRVQLIDKTKALRKSIKAKRKAKLEKTIAEIKEIQAQDTKTREDKNRLRKLKRRRRRLKKALKKKKRRKKRKKKRKKRKKRRKIKRSNITKKKNKKKRKKRKKRKKKNKKKKRKRKRKKKKK